MAEGAEHRRSNTPNTPPGHAHGHEHRECTSVKERIGNDKQIIVIKVGTSSLVRPEQHTLNISNLARICETVKTLHNQGHHVIIVSSGAVAVGCQRMGLTTKPKELARKQALAAVGQVHLMRFYEDFLSALDLRCAQVLLTLDNLANRDQYLNARNTFAELLAYGAIPVVNENDTVAVQELRFGDNDTLSAQVAALVQADWLFLLTDVDCLYTANPREDPNATPIYEVEDISRLTADTSSTGTQWGTGGMATKLTAGRIATAAGCTMVICNSKNPEAMEQVLAGAVVGTKFLARPHQRALRGRKRWILAVPIRGTIYMDDGAIRAVKDKKKSLFAAGITRVEGEFNAQDAVSLCDTTGREIGRGLVSFNNVELRQLKGHSAKDFSAALGYNAQPEVVHRENLALLAGTEGGYEHVDDDYDDLEVVHKVGGGLQGSKAAGVQGTTSHSALEMMEATALLSAAQ
eukprot:CAMPEP_0119103234 /NCGR_PEP_ID=MMETSP1180-20130426/1718_1 /TAXON_ID=3052 ORGANISM="Chlamydomonas cf sp, Strain CCMP681" /NCGR_SAMPLE_ID=MMETSP1180 /ASSEMBLY_ACC=CAM_ASM_000741 /LENGTH=461 /DNA_ID=CAMNT_0007087685 /DNA_START=29 /DNA_END=1414 /DNA_ORIENTATION=+